jgi:hypothetical protein
MSSEICDTTKVMVMTFIMALTVFMYANVLEAQVIEDGLVLYWSFDEADVKGDTVTDVVGDNDGTLNGGPKVSEGKYGDGLVFDGSKDNPYTILAPSNEREWSTWLHDYRTINQEIGINFRLIYEIVDEKYTVYFPVRPCSS